MQSHVVTNDLRQAQGFQRCCQYRDLAGNRPLLSQQAATSTAPARAPQVAKKFYTFLQQWVYLAGFSINPVQPFAQAYFMYYST